MENSLLRALFIGLVLAVGGIGLFLLLYYVIFAGFEPAARLISALVVPPIVMFVLVGGYFILTQDDKAE